MCKMENNRIVFLGCALLTGILLGGCKANQEDFGQERVYLSQAMVVMPIDSPYFGEAGVPAGESPLMTVNVAGVTRSGEMLDPADVTVEYKTEPGYLEARIAELQDPTVEMTDELDFLQNNNADVLPAACYEMGAMTIRIPSSQTFGTLSVTLKLDKIKELNLEKTWFLPAFILETASIEINRVRERSLVGLKFGIE